MGIDIGTERRWKKRRDDINQTVVGTSIFLGIGLAFVLVATIVIVLLVSLGIKILPSLVWISWVLIGLTILLFTPLATVNATKRFAGNCLFFASFVYGTTAWFMGLVLSFYSWKWLGVAIGIFLFGIGPIPVGMVSTISRGWWLEFFTLTAITILTFGTRLWGIALATEAEVQQSNVVIQDKRNRQKRQPEEIPQELDVKKSQSVTKETKTRFSTPSNMQKTPTAPSFLKVKSKKEEKPIPKPPATRTTSPKNTSPLDEFLTKTKRSSK